MLSAMLDFVIVFFIVCLIYISVNIPEHFLLFLVFWFVLAIHYCVFLVIALEVRIDI